MIPSNIATIIKWLLLYCIGIVQSGYNCTEEQPNQDCYILCDGSHGCNTTNPNQFICPSGYDCILNITADTIDNSLRDQHVYAQNSNNLTVYCDINQGNNCRRNYFCPIGNNGNCYFYANKGSWNYHHAIIKAENTNYLYIETHVSAALKSTTIYCPQQYKSGNQNNCIIKVDAVPSGTGPLYQTSIYTLESFTDLTLTCNLDKGSICGEGTINCGIDSCQIIQNGTNIATNSIDQWKCGDSSSLCQDLSFSPSSYPTSLCVFFFLYILLLIHSQSDKQNISFYINI